MNIMFLIFSFNTGGIERLLIDECGELIKNGHSVSLCVINKDYETPLLRHLHPEVRQILLDRPMGARRKFPYMRRLARIIRRGRYDILHCQGLNCVLFSAYAKLRFPHVKILNTVHDVNNFPRYSKKQVLAHNLLCSHIIAISKTVEAEILARGTSPKKVTTIYNAIDTSRFFLCAHPHIANGHASPIAASDVISIGNVARIIPEKKGQLVLLKAVAALKKTYPNIHCYFAGSITPGHEAHYQKLLDFVKKHDLENNVHFLGNVDDIPAFLQKTDIFVLPSFYEGFGIALIEALATGIPCIASNLDGPAEILSDESLGLLFTPGSAAQLAEKISYAIENYNRFMPEEISARVSAQYGIGEMVKAQCDLYDHCQTITSFNPQT